MHAQSHAQHQNIARGESSQGTPVLRLVGRTPIAAITNLSATELHYPTCAHTPRLPTVITHQKDHTHSSASVITATSPSGPPPPLDMLLRSRPSPPQPPFRCCPASPSTRRIESGPARRHDLCAREKSSNHAGVPLANGQPDRIEPAVAAAATHSRLQLVRSLPTLHTRASKIVSMRRSPRRRARAQPTPRRTVAGLGSSGPGP